MDTDRRANEKLLDELVDMLADRIAQKLDERRRIDALADIVLERLEAGGVAAEDILGDGKPPAKRKPSTARPAARARGAAASDGKRRATKEA
ncbi:MAG TPA: hypothetical protein PLD23_21280 [Armatimonadota bacterium]|nr:hypothetical protein [Armatimonadota bacterium]